MIEMCIIVFSEAYEWQKFIYIKIFRQFAKCVLILRVPNELVVIAEELSKEQGVYLNLGSSFFREDERAEKFVRHLSKVYRYILEIRDEKLIALKEELGYLKRLHGDKPPEQVKMNDPMPLERAHPDWVIHTPEAGAVVELTGMRPGGQVFSFALPKARLAAGTGIDYLRVASVATASTAHSTSSK